MPRSPTATKVTVLSLGPSMKSCTWLCWSVAPSAASGVGPTERAVGADLAQALRPQLDEPGAKSRKRVGVRHEHMDRAAEPRVGEPLEHGERAGRVLAPVAALAARSPSRRPRRAAPRRRCRSARRQQPDRRQHAEPPTDVRRDVERRRSRRRAAMRRSAPCSGSVTKTMCSAASTPRARRARPRTIRYCAIVSAVPPDFDVTMNSVRAEVEPVEQRRAWSRDRRCRAREGAAARSRFAVEQVPARRQQRGAQRDRAERRAADAEHHDVAYSAVRGRNCARSLAVPQRCSSSAGRGSPARPPRTPSDTARVRVANARGRAARAARRERRPSTASLSHVRVVETNRHVSRCER